MVLKHKAALLFLCERRLTRFTQVITHSRAQNGVSVSTSLLMKKIPELHQVDLVFRESFHGFAK